MFSITKSKVYLSLSILAVIICIQKINTSASALRFEPESSRVLPTDDIKFKNARRWSSDSASRIMKTAESDPVLDETVFLPLVIKACTANEINTLFSSSDCGWQSHLGQWTIEDNGYTTKGLEEKWATISYDAIFVNFDYRARFLRTGCDFCANQLIVRGLPEPLRGDGSWYSSYIFQYNQNGRFSVWKRSFGRDFVPLKVWTDTEVINQGSEWNELRVVAFNNLLLFFINDTRVWAGLDDTLIGGYVGIGMYRDDSSTNNQLTVEWATLSIIAPNDPNYATLVNLNELPLTDND